MSSAGFDNHDGFDFNAETSSRGIDGAAYSPIPCRRRMSSSGDWDQYNARFAAEFLDSTLAIKPDAEFDRRFSAFRAIPEAAMRIVCGRLRFLRGTIMLP
jgi:hypothetical protein